jgi:hypothetical protein
MNISMAGATAAALAGIAAIVHALDFYAKRS